MSAIALVADDHALFRKAVASLLMKECGIDEVIETETFDGAIEHLSKRREVSLAVMDLYMPGLKSASQMRILREAHADLRVVVLTSSTNRQDILDALAAGVHGFIRKTVSVSEIKSAIISVMDGNVYVPPEAVSYEGSISEARSEACANLTHRLTPRQLEISRYLRDGVSNKQIARELGLAENTVKVHINALFRTLGIRDRKQLEQTIRNIRTEVANKKPPSTFKRD